MKCNYCGADNKEEAKFCASCGAEIKEKAKKEEVKEEKVEVKDVKPEPVQTQPVVANKVTDGKATASLVLGICGLIIWCLSWILSLIGLILGIASKERSGKRTAGIVINAIVLAISTVFAIMCFMSWTAVVSTIEAARNGDDPFEVLEKELEKQEGIKTPAVESTITIGDDNYGYVKVPKNWHKFVDVDGNTTFQYTDIGQYGYIITLQYYEENISPLTAATNVKNSIVSEGNTAEVHYTKISTYYGYVVNAKYTDGTYLDAYLFKASDGKLHYVAIEGPDNTNDSFKIPDTFSMTK